MFWESFCASFVFFRVWIMTKTKFVLATFSKLRGFVKFLLDLGIQLKLSKIAFTM